MIHTGYGLSGGSQFDRHDLFIGRLGRQSLKQQPQIPRMVTEPESRRVQGSALRQFGHHRSRTHHHGRRIE